MSIFGDETITVTESPDEGQEEVMAEETENEESFDDNDESESFDQEDEGDGDDEQADDDEHDSSPEDGQDDGLILGKFKTKEDLAKAYQNLEREYTKARQGAGQQPGNQSSVVTQQNDQQQPDLNTMFWERFRDNPLQTMEAVIGHIVNDRTAPIFEERRTATLSSHIQNIAKSYPQVGTEEGLKQLVDKVREFAEEVGNPELIRNPTDKIMRFAAREAFGDTASKAFEKGKAAGRSESERTRQSKQGLGTKGGAKQQPAPAMSEEESTKAGILAAGRGGGLFG